MLWCHGKGCAVVISPSAAEESSLLIAAQIPVWVVGQSVAPGMPAACSARGAKPAGPE